MFGKCWSIQYINHEAYELRDKIHTQPMYFTTKVAMKAIHDKGCYESNSRLDC